MVGGHLFRSFAIFLSFPGDHLNLKLRPQRQSSHSDSGPRRIRCGELPGIDLVHSSKIIHVGQKDIDLDDVIRRQPGRGQNAKEIFEGLFRLGGDTAFCESVDGFGAKRANASPHFLRTKPFTLSQNAIPLHQFAGPGIERRLAGEIDQLAGGHGMGIGGPRRLRGH
jgi:hypothetical protein